MFTKNNTLVHTLCWILRIDFFCSGTVINQIKRDSLSSHPAWRQLDRLECGDSAGDRIIGGLDAALGQFPWVARIGYAPKTTNWTKPSEIDQKEVDFRCGGVLISDRHVITAAHCILPAEDTDVLYVVRVGEHDVRENPDCQAEACAPPVQDLLVRRVVGHARFNTPPFQNDIALVELTTPALLHDYVAPVCLPRTVQWLKEGELVTAAGWGQINMTTEETAETLQYVQLPVVKSELCNNRGRSFKMSAGQICAGGQTNKDACLGDSGGPLTKVYDTPEGPKHFLVGVVSFGPAICGKKPGVYSSVFYYLPWILNQLK